MDTFPEPVAGIDYPRNLQEFDRWFADETACRSYVFRVRWPEGYQCFRCRSKAPPWITSRGYLHCRQCGGEISITVGTVFERTSKPLRVWFQAIWLVTSQKHGVSALDLQRVLGLGGYQTAWTWLHKLRRAMVRPGRERLHGSIEVDETYVGGAKTGGKRGRGSKNKEIVVIAVELLSPKGFGRIRMRRIASLLKRWLLGIHQGAVSGKHLDYYLDEYTFRFNRRASRSRGMLFYRLMQQAVTTASTPYRQLVDGNHKM